MTASLDCYQIHYIHDHVSRRSLSKGSMVFRNDEIIYKCVIISHLVQILHCITRKQIGVYASKLFGD